jgi:hypothetical protein
MGGFWFSESKRSIEGKIFTTDYADFTDQNWDGLAGDDGSGK